MRDQKQLIILIIVASSLASFLAGYILTQTPKQSASILSEQRGALIDRFDGVVEKTTPTPLPAGLLKTSADSALSPVNLSGSDTLLYYHPDNGFVSKIDLETRKTTLISTTQLSDITNVIWSPDRNRVVTSSRTSNGLLYAYFDYTTRKHGTLGYNIKSVAFSPDNNSIVVFKSLGQDNQIQTSDFDGKNPKMLLKTRLQNIEVSWPAQNLISFSADDAGTTARSLYTLTETGNLNQLLTGKNQLMVNWSPDGSKLIYSSRDGTSVNLKLFNVPSKESSPMPITVSAKNCDWTNTQDSVICAVQEEGETSIIRTNIYSTTRDILFSHLIITPEEVFLSHSNNFLIIKSLADTGIWAVKLISN